MTKMYRTLGLLLMVLSMGMFSSCSPEKVLAKSLEGNWEVTSFTEDGTEVIGFLINTFNLEFKEYDGEEGDFTFTLIYANGTTETLSGEYELNSEGTEMDLTYTDGTVEQWDIENEKDDLTLETNLDGTRYVIQAERD